MVRDHPAAKKKKKELSVQVVVGGGPASPRKPGLRTFGGSAHVCEVVGYKLGAPVLFQSGAFIGGAHRAGGRKHWCIWWWPVVASPTHGWLAGWSSLVLRYCTQELG